MARYKLYGALTLILGAALAFSTRLTAQIIVDAGRDTVVCGSGSVPLGGNPTMVGGTPPITYTWMPATGLSNPGDPNPIATVSTTTTYIVSTSDFNGRGAFDTVTVFVINASNVKFDPIPDLCENDTIQILDQATPIGGIYSGPGVVISPRLNPALAGPGTHTITYSYTNPACTTTYTATQTLLIDTTPDLAIMINPDTICAGDTALITVTGASAYMWQPTTSLNDSVSGTVKAYPVSSTKYYVTGRSATGCSRMDSLEITVDACLPDGIDKNSSPDVVEAYPSPGNGLINLLVSNKPGITLQVLNVTGKQVHHQEIIPGGQKVDLTFLPEGMYFLSVFINGNQYVRKLIIDK